VEETVGHMARAYGVRRVDAYATPTGLSVSGEGSDGSMHTIVRRVPQTRNDLASVVAVNDLSRRASRGQVTLGEAHLELQAIRSAQSPYGPGVTVAAASLASAALAMLSGGAAVDMLGAAVAGLVVQSVTAAIEHRGWGGICSLMGRRILGCSHRNCITASGTCSVSALRRGWCYHDLGSWHNYHERPTRRYGRATGLWRCSLCGGPGGGHRCGIRCGARSRAGRALNCDYSLRQ
jgi:hypothetical protein